MIHIAICKLSKKSKVSNIQMVFIPEFSSAFPPNKKNFAHISLTAHILRSTGDYFLVSWKQNNRDSKSIFSAHNGKIAIASKQYNIEFQCTE